MKKAIVYISLPLPSGKSLENIWLFESLDERGLQELFAAYKYMTSETQGRESFENGDLLKFYVKGRRLGSEKEAQYILTECSISLAALSAWGHGPIRGESFLAPSRQSADEWVTRVEESILLDLDTPVTEVGKPPRRI